MPSGAVMRKLAVFNRIEQLPADEKERARKLYVILDRIEWLTTAPLYLGMFAILALPFLAAFMDGKLPGGKGTMLLYGFGGAAFCYVVGVFALKKLAFNPRRNGLVEQLRKMLLSNHNYRNTLETLKQFDPDLARHIKKCIAQVT